MNEYSVTFTTAETADPQTVSVSAESEDRVNEAVENVYGERCNIHSVEEIDRSELLDETAQPSVPNQSGMAKVPPEETSKTAEPPTETVGESPASILHSNAELYEQKNNDYGDAWRIAGETLAAWASELDIEFDERDGHQAASWNLYMQRLHKLLRSFNLEFSNQSENNEAVSESHEDASTYAAIHASHVADTDE